MAPETAATRPVAGTAVSQPRENSAGAAWAEILPAKQTEPVTIYANNGHEISDDDDDNEDEDEDMDELLSGIPARLPPQRHNG